VKIFPIVLHELPISDFHHGKSGFTEFSENSDSSQTRHVTSIPHVKTQKKVDNW